MQFICFFTPQYLERELRMEGLSFPYSFEVCDMMEFQGWVNSRLGQGWVKVGSIELS